MKKSLYTKALLGMTLSLSGCMGIYEGGFECPPGKGVGCRSISDVNQMVDQGELPERSPVNLPETQCERCGSQITPGYLEKPKIWYPSWKLKEA